MPLCGFCKNAFDRCMSHTTEAQRDDEKQFDDAHGALRAVCHGIDVDFRVVVQHVPGVATCQLQAPGATHEQLVLDVVQILTCGLW